MNNLAPQYLLYVYVLVALLITWEIFFSFSKCKSIQTYLIKFKKWAGVTMSYVIVGILGAVLAMGYWWGIQKIFPSPEGQIEEESGLIIEYKENEPDYFAQSFKQGQLYRISVKNSSPTKMIKNVKTKLIKIDPLHPVFQYIRPVLLRFMGDTKEKPDQLTNLGPLEPIFIDVIELHAGNREIEILTSEVEKHTKAIISKDDTFIITIQVSGDGIKTETKQFEFGINTNEFGGDWKLWFRPVNQEVHTIQKDNKINEEKEELKSMIGNTLDELGFNVTQCKIGSSWNRVGKNTLFYIATS